LPELADRFSRHYAQAVSEDGTVPPESERLARLYFELARRADTAKLLELLHPDIEISLKSRSGETLRGREDVARYLSELSEARSMMESTAERFRVVDDGRVIAEGRLRWMDENRILRDDPVVWALEFREGLLLRSTPTRSVGEAEAILAAASTGAAQDV
jgi:ketosteroid isomerase-like protein